MSFLRRLYSFDNNVDFRKGWRIAIAISCLFILISLVSFGTQGLRLGIDFRGGVSWQFQQNSATTDQVRAVMAKYGAGDALVQSLSGSNGNKIRVEASKKLIPKQREITADLAGVAHVNPADVSVSTVGPSWGKDVSKKALKALIVFLVAIAIYITIRIEWKLAVAALVGVGHDILVSLGVYSIFQFEITPGTVVAFLTILGYSLYDTIVVYDKIKENTKLVTPNGGYTYTDMINLSLNETFVRSINTTLSAILPVLSILFIGAGVLGAVTLEEFGLALLVGLICGAYSSVFISAPLAAWLKEREPRNRAIRERILAQRAAAVEEPEVALQPRAAGLSQALDQPEGAERAHAQAGESAEAEGVPAPIGARGDGESGDGDSGAATAAAASQGPKASKPSAPQGANRSGPYSANHPPRPRKHTKGKRR